MMYRKNDKLVQYKVQLMTMKGHVCINWLLSNIVLTRSSLTLVMSS